MALPYPDVPLKLIGLYRYDHDQTYSKPVETVKSFAETTVGYLTGNNSVVEKIDKICQLVVERIKSASTIDDWLNLILFLGKQAELAQSFKIDTSRQSELCSTLHVIRDYLVTHLQKDTDCRIAYTQRVDDLIEKYKYKQKQIEEAVKPQSTTIDKHGMSWGLLNRELNDLILELAYLNEPTYIGIARQFHLLDYLKVLKGEDDPHIEKLRKAGFDYNCAFPICLQPAFYLSYYSFEWVQYTKKPFQQFELDTITTPKIVITTPAASVSRQGAFSQSSAPIISSIGAASSPPRSVDEGPR